MTRLPDNHGSMTAADIIDGLTGSECRIALLACLQAVERAHWHRDRDRFIRDMKAAVDAIESRATFTVERSNVPRKSTNVGESHHRARYSNDTVDRARALRDKGFSYHSIASKIGVPWETVRDWVTCRSRIAA